MRDNIALFINSLSSGGAEHQLVILANFLAEKGYNITIATYGDVNDHYELHSCIKRLHIAPNRHKIYKIFGIWKFGLTVKADCVISFCQRNSFFLLPSLFLRSRKSLKVICGERNLSLGNPDQIEYMLFNFLYKRADYIVPNSNSQRKYIITHCSKFSDKVKTITNYTDLDIFTVSPPPNNTVRRIGIFCRYEKQKNCIRFVKAVKQAVEKCRQPFVVEWYGNQNFNNNVLQDYFNQLSKLVIDYKLNEVIHLNGAVASVPSLMSSFDAICLPSLFEGFSNSIAEAICCGKPVIVSDVSDNILMVHNGENGYLFDPLKTDQISESIIKIVTLSSVELAKMGKISRKIAETLFDKKKFIESYIKLIES